MLDINLRLCGWYGIGDREVAVSAKASRKGVRIYAQLPPLDPASWLEAECEEKSLTWDEVEKNERLVELTAAELAREVVKRNLGTKKPGEVYSDF